MKALGIRCWRDRIAFVVLEGTQTRPVVLASRIRDGPAGTARADLLVWIREMIWEILDGHEPDVMGFKAIEGNSRTRDLHRAEVEGVVQESARSHRLRREAFARTKVQIKRGMPWFADQASHVERALNQAGLEPLNTERLWEAAVVALSQLPSEAS